MNGGPILKVACEDAAACPAGRYNMCSTMGLYVDIYRLKIDKESSICEVQVTSCS